MDSTCTLYYTNDQDEAARENPTHMDKCTHYAGASGRVVKDTQIIHAGRHSRHYGYENQMYTTHLDTKQHNEACVLNPAWPEGASLNKDI